MSKASGFKVVAFSKRSRARATLLSTDHGTIAGPFFMPIATRGAVKTLSADDLRRLKAPIVLGNTYHLIQHPGPRVLRRLGGLHALMDWSGPLLTDSGGFQVFSLGRHRKITPSGVAFTDPESGKRTMLTPERSIRLQKIIGADIMMVLDECVAYPASPAYIKESIERTTAWALRCRRAQRLHRPRQLLFGIVQGGVYKRYRQRSAQMLVEIGFDGYAIGGVSVGEPRSALRRILHWVVPLLPMGAPRYLMGVGRPDEIVQAVREGIDMFDCVIPTREARHGRLYCWLPSGRHGRKTFSPNFDRSFFTTLHITNRRYASDTTPLSFPQRHRYTRAYLHHLLKTREPLGPRLASLSNLHFYLELMRHLRRQILHGRL